VMKGHSHRVYSVAFSHDSSRIVSGSEDKTIRVWEVADTLKAVQEKQKQVKLQEAKLLSQQAKLLQEKREAKMREEAIQKQRAQEQQRIRALKARYDSDSIDAAFLNSLSPKEWVTPLDPDTRDTLLHLAARDNKLPLLSVLLDRAGAKAWRTTNKDGETVAHVAVRASEEAGELVILRAERKNLSDVLLLRLPRGRTVLHEAARTGHAGTTRRLCGFRGGKLLETTDEKGNTPLAVAVKYYKNPETVVQVVHTLIDAGANPAVTCDGDASLMEVARGLSKAISAPVCAALREGFEGSLKDSPLAQQWRDQNPDIRKSGTTSTSSFPVQLQDAPTAHLAAALERVRVGTFSLATDSIFTRELSSLSMHADSADEKKKKHTTASVHTLLFHGLACVAHKHTDAEETEEVLEHYEAALTRTDTPAHPLFYLLHARVALKRGNARLAWVLLSAFKDAAAACDKEPECAGLFDSWASEVELALLADDTVVVPTSPGGAGGGGGAVDASDASSSPVDKQWVRLREMLTDAQREPMEELLKMTGLAQVKLTALGIYADVLADEKLREDGFGDAVRPRTLNFAFLGNPGTGKTTCARLFARMMSAAGARAGHNFVALTAQQALRMGSKEFAKTLESLTGKGVSSGPPPSIDRIHSKVEVRLQNQWYPGVVNFVHSTNPKTYDVKFANGDIETNLAANQLKAVSAQQAGVGGVLFLDEAYDLNPASDSVGRTILADIMSTAEDHRDTVSIILAGYKDDVEKNLFSFNIGMPSRFQCVPVCICVCVCVRVRVCTEIPASVIVFTHIYTHTHIHNTRSSTTSANKSSCSRGRTCAQTPAGPARTASPV
jgi:hypothetical protein